MASNPFVNEFCFKAIAAALQRDEDAGTLVTLAGDVRLLREAGALTDAQVSGLGDLLGVEIEVPDAPDTFVEAIEGLTELVGEHDDAIAELGEVVSEIVGGGDE